jgi:hypothetical protein
MRLTSFRYCMTIGALALGGVSLFYFINYAVVLNVALGNSGVKPFLQASIRAMWLAFACQTLLVGLLYGLVSVRPHAVSREVIVLLGLLQLVESTLLFTFAGSTTVALLLALAAFFVILGSFLWPKRLPPAPPPATAAPPPPP